MGDWRASFLLLPLVLCVAACGAEQPGVTGDNAEAEGHILKTHDAIVAAMVAGTSTAAYHTDDWRGVNLNGTPMSASGFEGEKREMTYDRIEVLDHEVRVYGDTAAVRWHANFWVKVNGQSSFAEMRILDVYVRRAGEWKSDLTQVTPVYGTVGNPPEGR